MDIEIYEKDKIDERLYFKELDSGLKIYFFPKRGYTKKYAIFATNYGSVDNVFIPLGEKEPIEVPEGIAHFLEHKLFEEPDQNIFDKFSDYGADVNAFTNFDQTAYLFNTTDNFHESLETLVKFVQHPHFTDENVDKEKGIIAQEINMYKDNASWRVFFNLLNAMYTEHPVKIDIAGTVDSIQDINKELLYKSYNTFYNPSNMVLAISGDLSFEEIIATVEKAERKDYEKVEEIDRDYGSETEYIKTDFVEEEMMISTPIFYMGFKDSQLGLKGEELVKKDLITNLILEILFSSSSPFYNELYDEGLIDSSFGAYYTGKESYGHSIVLGQAKKPKLVYDRILDLFKDDVESIIPKEDFNRMMKNSIGDFLMGCNSVEFLANNFVDLYFDGFLLIDYLDLLESIKYEDLIERFKEHFKEDNVVLSIINPLSNS